jgi:hypothetical protein
MISSIKYYFITGMVCLAIGIAAVFLIQKTGTKTADIKMKFGENELNIKLDQEVIEASEVLDKIFKTEFSREGTLAWLKDHQHLYAPDDPDIMPAFDTMAFDQIVAEKLRQLSFRREGPWAYQLDTVSIGIPDSLKHQPKEGFANACGNGIYFMKNLRIYSMDQQREIEVIATGKYECPKLFKFPDIQLNPVDAAKLLGTTNFSEYEHGMALILVQE